MNQGSQAIVWRDSKTNQGSFTCPAQAGVRPPWYPLNEESLSVFDEQEHPQVPAVCQNQPCAPPPSTANLFPAATQKLPFNSSTLLTSFNEGWAYLDLHNNQGAGNPNPPFDPAAQQAWVILLYDQGAGAGGNNNGNSWEMGERGSLLDSAENPIHFAP
jgi:hypothetical protein